VNPSGDKQVTSDDEDDTAATTTTTTTSSSPAHKGKPVCKWGAACYQSNKPHLEAFSHPNKSTAKTVAAPASTTPAAAAATTKTEVSKRCRWMSRKKIYLMRNYNNL
jgi:hypothetical protein